MIKCNNCGTELNDGTQFCFNCGERIDTAAASQNPYYTQPQTKDYDLYNQTFEKRKSINPKKIIAIAAAVVVVAGIAVLAKYSNRSANNRSYYDYDYNYNTTQRTTEPTTNSADTEKSTEKATEKVTQKATQKATEKATQKATNPSPSTNKSSNNPIGVRKEFKDTCDSYEKFIDEYVAFMKKDHSSMEYLSQSLEYLNKLTEWNEKFDSLGAMNDAETLYYLEVQSRTLQKMAEAY